MELRDFLRDARVRDFLSKTKAYGSLTRPHGIDIMAYGSETNTSGIGQTPMVDHECL